MERLIRDGVSLAFEDTGVGAPPLIFVHDLGHDHSFFAHQVASFTDSHRVVAIDLRGHGRSGKPRQGYTIEVLAEDLTWLCYELGLYRPVAVGRGLGVAVAVAAAVSHPDLLLSIISLSSPRALSENPSARSHAPQHVLLSLLENARRWDAKVALAANQVPILWIPLNAPGEQLRGAIENLVAERK